MPTTKQAKPTEIATITADSANWKKSLNAKHGSVIRGSKKQAAVVGGLNRHSLPAARFSMGEGIARQVSSGEDSTCCWPLSDAGARFCKLFIASTIIGTLHCDQFHPLQHSSLGFPILASLTAVQLRSDSRRKLVAAIGRRALH